MSADAAPNARARADPHLLPARLAIGNRRRRRRSKKPVSAVFAVLYRDPVSVMFGRDRTALLTIYPVGPPKQAAMSDATIKLDRKKRAA
jgi:hypothetical protein